MDNCVVLPIMMATGIVVLLPLTIYRKRLRRWYEQHSLTQGPGCFFWLSFSAGPFIGWFVLGVFIVIGIIECGSHG